MICVHTTIRQAMESFVRRSQDAKGSALSLSGYGAEQNREIEFNLHRLHYITCCLIGFSFAIPNLTSVEKFKNPNPFSEEVQLPSLGT